MKKLALLIATAFIFTHPNNAQVSIDLDSDFAAVKSEYNQRNVDLNHKIDSLNSKILELDESIQGNLDDQERISALSTRVQLLEEKQEVAEERSLSIYQGNYFTAVAELLFMDQSIRPIELLVVSQDFFSAISDAANPTNYEEFNTFLEDFDAFANDKKNTGNAILETAQDVLVMTENFTKDMAIAGPLTTVLMEGISIFLNGNAKNKKMKETGRQALQIVSTLSYYAYEVKLVEQEWLSISEELATLKDLRQRTIERSLKILGIDELDFERNYTNNVLTLPSKAQAYIFGTVRNKVDERVREEKDREDDKSVHNWKTLFHQEMQSVQSLKIRLGTLMARLQQNLNSYATIIERFKDNETLKVQMQLLEGKLESLNTTFNENFQPQMYIESASTMYEIE